MEVRWMKRYKWKKGDGIKMAIPVIIVIVLFFFFPSIGNAMYDMYNDAIIWFFVLLFIGGVISLIGGIFSKLLWLIASP